MKKNPHLLRSGNPLLYEKSLPFDLPKKMPLAHQIFQLMQEVTKNIGNLGIAAPQIGILRQIVMFEVPAEHPRYKTDGIAIPQRVLLNSSYKPTDKEETLNGRLVYQYLE